MNFRVIDGGGRKPSKSAAETGRADVIEQVAMAIWDTADGIAPGVNWPDAQHLPELAAMVAWTLKAARSAIEALQIGEHPVAGQFQMALAGEHAIGVDPHICIEAFDAMLAEVLIE